MRIGLYVSCHAQVFHVLPFGSLGAISLTDVCVGILTSGLFMMYFGGSRTLHCPLAGCPVCNAALCPYHLLA